MESDADYIMESSRDDTDFVQVADAAGQVAVGAGAAAAADGAGLQSTMQKC